MPPARSKKKSSTKEDKKTRKNALYFLHEPIEDELFAHYLKQIIEAMNFLFPYYSAPLRRARAIFCCCCRSRSVAFREKVSKAWKQFKTDNDVNTPWLHKSHEKKMPWVFLAASVLDIDRRMVPRLVRRTGINKKIFKAMVQGYCFSFVLKLKEHTSVREELLGIVHAAKTSLYETAEQKSKAVRDAHQKSWTKGKEILKKTKKKRNFSAPGDSNQGLEMTTLRK